MDAGRLRERVEIQEEARVSNGQGGYKTDWVRVANKVPAEVIALSGDEALRLGVERSTSQYRVTMRRRHDLNSKRRLLWDGQVMEIRSVIPDPRDRAAVVAIAEIRTGS